MGTVNLGPRRALGAQDQTGFNAGNWTVSFTSDIINVEIPFFEVYRIIVTANYGSTFTTYKNMAQWDPPTFAPSNLWMGSLPLIPGDALYFYFSDPVGDGDPPAVTLWLQYDTSIPANASVKQGYTGG